MEEQDLNVHPYHCMYFVGRSKCASLSTVDTNVHHYYYQCMSTASQTKCVTQTPCIICQCSAYYTCRGEKGQTLLGLRGGSDKWNIMNGMYIICIGPAFPPKQGLSFFFSLMWSSTTYIHILTFHGEVTIEDGARVCGGHHLCAGGNQWLHVRQHL